jgi:hypothetical protein
LIATACGYRRAEIDDMTLPDYLELAAYWKKNPPLHLLIKAALGYKGVDETRTSDLAELLAGAGSEGVLRG